ncbi:hypothetical protein P4C99_00445 [Pontiellaceae bacterium B1224]|nr:hypothetical protein [Pontiellaceae bacterium B1224]
MKQIIETYRGVVKGTSSGWMISLLFHLGIGVVATSIFFVVQKKPDPIIFRPAVVRPPIELELMKPQVKIRDASTPERSISRITVPRNSLDRPEVVVSSLGGGEGLSLGDFSVDFELPKTEQSLVGDDFGTGFGFVGTFYDFKRDREGGTMIMDPHQFVAEVARFVRYDWKTSKLSRFYRSKKQLHAECFMVPPVKSSVAPAAFDEADTLGYCWLAHYKGQLVYHEDITFRFWGHGDDVMAVRVDGKEVLVACWPGSTWSPQDIICSAAGGWQSSSSKSRIYTLGNNTAVVGDWITLKKGEPLDMEVIIGEVPGGTFCSMLTVEVQGADYELNREQAPILPMFKTSEPSHDLKDRIYEWLTYDQVSLTGGPVFRDIPPAERSDAAFQSLEKAPDPVQLVEPHLWSGLDGELFEAEFVSVLGNAVVLKSADGELVRLPLAELTSNDRNFVGLAELPEFICSVTKQSDQRIIKTTPYLDEIPPRLLDYTFGAKIRQTSARAYEHAVYAELFIFGQQRIDDRKYILLDHQTSSFVPGKENRRSHVFKGSPVELMSYDTDQPLGRKYSDYLLILTDERGEVIQQQASAAWIFPNLGNLRKLQVGNFLDDTCTRVYPTGPGPKSLYN